jgi:hypothetical protein
MSLKIRRGTDSERVTITPAEGELIYTTDTKLLYVGDGTTTGGRVVTASGGGTGYVGSQGDVGFAGSRGLQGDVGYVGSASTAQGPKGDKGDTGIGIPTGGTTGQVLSKASGTNYDVNWSTVSGGGGSNGGTLTSNLVLSTYSITGTSLTISGSSISTPAISVKDILPNANDKGIIIGNESDPCGVGIFIKNGSSFNIHSTLANGNAPTFALNAYNGTLMAKESVVDGDILGILLFKGFNGFKVANSIAMASITNDQSFTASSDFIKSDLFIGMPNQIGQPSKQFVMIKSNGDVSANTITVNQFATSSLPSSPVKGMIAFDSTTNQFKGWNGSSWVVLG